MHVRQYRLLLQEPHTGDKQEDKRNHAMQGTLIAAQRLILTLGNNLIPQT